MQEGFEAHVACKAHYAEDQGDKGGDVEEVEKASFYYGVGVLVGGVVAKVVC